MFFCNIFEQVGTIDFYNELIMSLPAHFWVHIFYKWFRTIYKLVCTLNNWVLTNYSYHKL